MTVYIIMGIVLELLQHQKTTAQKIANKYEISTRSVYRYINSLCASGFPVITYLGRSGGIGLQPNFSLKNLYFSEQELELLIGLCNRQSKKTPESTALCEKLQYIKMNNNTAK